MKPSLLMTSLRASARFLVGLVLLGCYVIPHTVRAQAPAWVPFSLPKLQQTTLTSAAGAPYRIVVATPAGPAPAGGYPVIYVVDGNAWTGLVSEIIRTNVDWGIASRVEPAVVVGIGYPTDAAIDLTRRTLDLTSPFPGLSGDPTGGDVAFMDFIDKVVKPVVEARFKINRTRQTLVGHSLGGLFTLSTMFNRPQLFQTYVALSPSIWWNHGVLLQKAEDFVKKPDHPRTLRLFLSVGSLEQNMTPAYMAHARDVERQMYAAEGKSESDADKEVADMKASLESKMMVDNVHQMVALLMAAHIKVNFVEFSDEDHFSVVPSALGGQSLSPSATISLLNSQTSIRTDQTPATGRSYVQEVSTDFPCQFAQTHRRVFSMKSVI